MTRRKKPETPADGPAPDRGGAWIRQSDGTLIRDPDEDQQIPEGKDPKEPGQPAAPDIAPPPAAQDQEG